MQNNSNHQEARFCRKQDQKGRERGMIIKVSGTCKDNLWGGRKNYGRLEVIPQPDTRYVPNRPPNLSQPHP